MTLRRGRSFEGVVPEGPGGRFALFSCFFLFLDRFLSGPFFFCFVGCRVPPGARVHIGAARWWALWAFDFYLRNDYFFMVRLNGFEQVEKVDFVK